MSTVTGRESEMSLLPLTVSTQKSHRRRLFYERSGNLDKYPWFPQSSISGFRKRGKIKCHLLEGSPLSTSLSSPFLIFPFTIYHHSSSCYFNWWFIICLLSIEYTFHDDRIFVPQPLEQCLAHSGSPLIYLEYLFKELNILN